MAIKNPQQKRPAKNQSLNNSTEKETFGLLLLSVRLSLIRRADRLLASGGFDVSYTHVRVLRVLSQSECMGATELARVVEHDGGALTRLLDRLQEKGYVARRPNAKDRRAIEVHMTDAGRLFWKSLQGCVKKLNTDVLDALDDVEQKQLFTLLHRVRDRLDELAGQ